MPILRRIKKILIGEPRMAPSSHRHEEFGARPLESLYGVKFEQKPAAERPHGHNPYAGYLNVPNTFSPYGGRKLVEVLKTHPDAASAKTTPDERQRLIELAIQLGKVKHFGDEIDRLRAKIESKKFYDPYMPPGFLTVKGGQPAGKHPREGLARSLYGMKSSYRSVNEPAQKFKDIKVPVIGSIPFFGKFFNLTAQGLLNAVTYPVRRRYTARDVIEQNIKENRIYFDKEDTKLKQMLATVPNMDDLLNRYNQDIEHFVKSEAPAQMPQKRQAALFFIFKPQVHLL